MLEVPGTWYRVATIVGMGRDLQARRSTEHSHMRLLQPNKGQEKDEKPK